MEDIFKEERSNQIQAVVGYFFHAFLIIGVFILFYAGINYVSRSNADHQEESLNAAVSRDIVQCYSLEGVYPPSLDYLKQHYGLVYDENLFYIDYRPIASNIYPDVTILRLDGKGEASQ